MAIIIQIIFDNRSAVFYPGQQITGNVKIILNSPKQTRGVVMKFKGKAKVSWSERRGKDKTVYFKAEEEYYEMEFYVWGNGSRQTLEPGEYMFPFNFILPSNVPGSYESVTGRVKHECSAKIDLCEAFDKKKTVLFSVNPVYDLNADPLSIIPITGNKHKMICCCCCKSGPISVNLNVSHSGFVCGEAITIFAECSNMSNRNVDYSSASVYQKVTFKARGGGRKEKTKLVCDLQRPSIPPGESDIWSGVKLVLPPLPPSHLPGCSIIDIQYEFRFKVSPSGGINLSIKRPILIGTIPLQRNFNRIVVIPPQINVPPTAPDLDIQPAPSTGFYTSNPPSYQSLYPDCPPPEYAECKSMAGDVSSVCSDSNDDDGDEHPPPFKPRYLSYGFV